MLRTTAIKSLLVISAVSVTALAIGCEDAPNAAPSGDSQSSNAESPEEETKPEGEVAYKEAVVGVGKKGKKLEKEKGIGKAIVTPAVALFRFKQKAVFEIQIPHAMNLYKATHGNFPKTQQEFDSKIVKANNIKLPELEEGQKYFYDPSTGKLMVEYRKPTN